MPGAGHVLLLPATLAGMGMWIVLGVFVALLILFGVVNRRHKDGLPWNSAKERRQFKETKRSGSEYGAGPPDDASGWM